MNLDYGKAKEIFENRSDDNAIIKVIGVGGGGGNVINRMIKENITDVDLIIANTDQKDLNKSTCLNKISLGTKLTRGLGAGMNPEVGKSAAEESRKMIEDLVDGADMVVLACGMGGGTGTGATPMIAQYIREINDKILIVGVVTQPFDFEGKKRSELAKSGIEELKKYIDTLMVIPNQRLFELQTKSGPLKFNEAFKLADDVLMNAIRGITDLTKKTGFINIDFADVRTVMSRKGRAIIGVGHSNDPKKRCVDAATQAISSPLLDNQHIGKATGVIIHIIADESISLDEVQESCQLIEGAAESADVIFGLTYDDTKNQEVEVMIIATGFENYHSSSFKPSLSVNKVFETLETQNRLTTQVTEIKEDSPAVGELLDPPKNTKESAEDTYTLSHDEMKEVENKPYIPEHLKNKSDKDDIDVPAFIRRRQQ